MCMYMNASRLRRNFGCFDIQAHSGLASPGPTCLVITFWTDEGWPYLAVVLDLFNREVVGWSIKPRTTADLVTDALTMAWFRRKPESGAMHHSWQRANSTILQALHRMYSP